MTPLNVGGMQNTLASVAAAGRAPVEMGPAGAPFSVTVRTACEPNAPGVRCLHAVQGSPPQSGPVKAAQSASLVHATAGFLKTAPVGSLQKPQKTRVWLGSSTAVFVAVAVVSRKGTGKVPLGEPGGGQSWLVGHCGPITSRVPAAHPLPPLCQSWHPSSPATEGRGEGP